MLKKIEDEKVDKTGLEHMRETPMAWIIRVIKGALIGIGAILPGLSGGVLMVVFGIYDHLISFLGNFPKNFKKYFFFFLPIGIGGILGILLFAGLVSVAFGKFAAQFVSLFIGFVAGTVPSLWKTAGLKGRGKQGYTALIVAALVILILMLNGENQLTSIEPNFIIWIGGGVLVGLGFIVPGLSPSNFLIYFGMYSKMSDGISNLDFSVIVPLMLGVLLAIIAFAKLVSKLFEYKYEIMYHIILGTVLGSSLAIFPTVVAPGLTAEGLLKSGLSFVPALALVIIMFALGMIASLLFSRVEDRYSPDN
jgi:putative membrane protein